MNKSQVSLSLAGLAIILFAISFSYFSPVQFISPNTTKKEYHIKVACYGTPTDGHQFYCIMFTNNNWIDSANIMEFAHVEEVDYSQLYLCYDSNTPAIDISKKLRTYNECLRYNDSVRVLDSLFKESIKPASCNCETTQVY